MGTGGSRYGAGRPGWKRKCERSLPLDIRKLHRCGLLSPIQSFGWQWTQGDEPCGNIGITVHEHRVQLRYTWTPASGGPQHKCYDVWVERTRCHYGGSRAWFRCPWCQRRCAVFYGGPKNSQCVIDLSRRKIEALIQIPRAGVLRLLLPEISSES